MEYFPGFTTLQLCYKVLEFMSKMIVQLEDFMERIIFMSMFNDISWRSKENKQECELSARLVSTYAKRFSPRRWSFLGPGSEKKWYSTHERKPQGEWDRVAELMMIRMRVKCSTRFSTCKKIWSKTMVISRSWFRDKVVFYQCRWTTR